MTFRHVRVRSRARSSGSISSTSSESLPSVPAFDFTLYGSPAPRSAHRTSSGAAKPKSRRRCSKPMPAPPASPLSTYCTEELQLDLSSLAAEEDELIVANNGSEIRYREYDTVFDESSNQVTDATKDNHLDRNSNVESHVNGENKNPCSETIETRGLDNVESADRAISLLDYDKASGTELRSESQDFSTKTGSSIMESQYSDRGRVSSDFLSSDESFSSEESGSSGSCLSGSSSSVTLNEHSLDSCSSACSLKSRNSHEHEISISNGSSSSRETSGDLYNKISCQNNKVEHKSSGVALETLRKGNYTQQITRRLPNENFCRNPENSRQKENSTGRVSGAITNRNVVTELQIALSCGGKDNACAPDSSSVSIEGRNEKNNNVLVSSARRNAYGISTTPVDPITDQRVVVNKEKRELNNTHCDDKHIASDKASDNVENRNSNSKSSKLHGHYFLDKGNEIQTEERIIEEERRAEQLCICCAAGNTKTCSCLPNSVLLLESSTASPCNSALCDTGIRFSRSKSHFGEKPDENTVGVDVTSRNMFSAAVRAEPASSILNIPSSSGNFVSLTNLENDEDYDETFYSNSPKNQMLPPNNQMLQQDFYSAPIRPNIPNTVGSLSVMTCDCESGRISRHLLERLDAGYFPDISLPAGEVIEAAICARQLVCVLERALERTLSSNTNDRNTDSSVGESSASFSTNFTRRKQRSNSLSPSILRRCKETDAASTSTTIEFRPDGKHSVLDCDIAAGKREGVNPKEICDLEPPFSGDGVGTRCSCVVAPPLLIVSAEELRKQRTLLKPANDRRVRGTVVQGLDMADVLRRTISRRRRFLDPSEEFICGNNRSVSECSLENA